MKTLAFYRGETGVITLREIIDEQCAEEYILEILFRKDSKVGENV